MFFLSKVKDCFRQGENNKRHKILKAIMEQIHEEHTEDNYYTNLYWIVEELLMSDPYFLKNIQYLNLDILKNGLSNVVDDAAERVKHRFSSQRKIYLYK